MTSRYLYAVIRGAAPRTFEAKGIGARGDTVYTITNGKLSAVVSLTPPVEYENTRRNMMAHQLVLEEVMRSADLLPVRFGTVAPDDATIITRLLDLRGEELDHMLEQMRDRVELGLKASWQEGVVFKEILEDNLAILKLRDSLVGRTPEKSHFDRMKLGEMIAKAMADKRQADELMVLDRVRAFVHKTKLNKPIGDEMVLNAAFLVERAQEPALDAAIKQMDAEIGHRLKFRYVGPVPPYNFVNIIVSLK